MGPEVEEHPSALGGRRPVAPRLVTELGRPTLEPRLVAEHLSQLPLAQQTAQGQLVGIPAPVVERRQHQIPLLGALDEAERRFRRRRHRLVDDHGQAGLQCLRGQRNVGVVGRRHDNQVVLRHPRPELLDVRQDLGPGVGSPSALCALRIAGDDAGYREP
jgi:hypothetical protein